MKPALLAIHDMGKPYKLSVNNHLPKLLFFGWTGCIKTDEAVLWDNLAVSL